MYREVSYSFDSVDPPLVQVHIDGAYERRGEQVENDQTGYYRDTYWKARRNVLGLKKGKQSMLIEFPASIIPEISAVPDFDDLFLWIATEAGTLTRIEFDSINSLCREWHKKHSNYVVRSATEEDPITCITAIDQNRCLLGLRSGQIVQVDVTSCVDLNLNCTEAVYFTSWAGSWLSSFLSKKTKRAEVKAIKSLGNKYVITVGVDGYLRVYSSTMREELKSIRIVHIDENTEYVKYPSKPIRVVQRDEGYTIVVFVNPPKSFGRFVSINFLEREDIELSFDVESKMAPYPNLHDYVLIDGNVWGLWKVNEGYKISTGQLLEEATTLPGFLTSTPQPAWTHCRTLYDDIHIPENVDEDEYRAKWLSHNLPIGLIEHNTFIGLVRSKSLQVVRLGDVLECATAETMDQKWGTLEYFNGRSEQVSDVLHLTLTLKKFRNRINQNSYAQFIDTLPLHNPTQILANAAALVQSIGTKFENRTRGVSLLIELLTELTDHHHFGVTANRSNADDFDKLIDEIARLPSVLIGNTLAQIITTRFELSTELLLFLVATGNTAPAERVAQIVRMYGIFNWLKSEYVQQSSMEALTQSNSDTAFRSSGPFFQVIVEFYQANSILGEDFMGADRQSIHFANKIHLIVYLSLRTLANIWSIRDDQKSNAIKFAHLLHANRQYSMLKDYCYILIDDIPWLHHFLGFALLNYDLDRNKAKDHFILCGTKLSGTNALEMSLTQALFTSMGITLKQTDDIIKDYAFLYFNHLRTRMDHFPDLVIEFVNLALGEYVDDFNYAEEVNILWSILASWSLSCERYDDAYVAIVNNCDDVRRKADLRRFVHYICDKGLFQILNDLPYMDMIDQISNTLEELAGSVDVNGPIRFYDALYIFHTHRGDYAQSAQVMWQYAQRIEQESSEDIRDALERRVTCLLNAITSLKLLPASERHFIVFPPSSQPPVQKRKRNASPSVANDARSSKLIDVHQIEAEYLRTIGILSLPADTIVGTRNPSDMVILLAKYKVFDIALSIAKHHSLPMNIIFTELTRQCVQLQVDPNSGSEIILDEEITFFGDDIGLHFQDMREKLWNLLQTYLKMYNGDIYAPLCVDIILEYGLTVPIWLNAYTLEKNPDALIRAYLKYDLLEDCIQFFIQLMKRNQTMSLTLVDVLLSRVKEAQGKIADRGQELRQAIRDTQTLH